MHAAELISLLPGQFLFTGGLNPKSLEKDAAKDCLNNILNGFEHFLTLAFPFRILSPLLLASLLSGLCSISSVLASVPSLCLVEVEFLTVQLILTS